MAIAYDSSSTEFIASGGTATASGSFTCGSGDNRVMFIGIINYSGADDITSVSYNGVSASLVDKIGFNTVGTPTNYVYLYYLVNPASGSNTLSATRTNTTSSMNIFCSTFTGAKQSGIPDNSTKIAIDDGSTITATLTTVADNCWTVIVGGSQRNLTAGTGTTLRVGSGGQEVIGDSNGAKTPAGSTSMVLNISGASSRLTGVVMASFAPSLPTNSNFLMFM